LRGDRGGTHGMTEAVVRDRKIEGWARHNVSA
jgi:hypothetical protein